MNDEYLKCSCCNQQKNTLTRRGSRLIRGTKIIICPSCDDKGLEPRYIVILAWMNPDLRDKAASFIKDYKYLGDPIQLQETL